MNKKFNTGGAGVILACALFWVALLLLLLSSCSPLTKQQRMQRAMFDPKTSYVERQIIRAEKDSYPDEYPKKPRKHWTKMPKRPKK